MGLIPTRIRGSRYARRDCLPGKRPREVVSFFGGTGLVIPWLRLIGPLDAREPYLLPLRGGFYDEVCVLVFVACVHYFPNPLKRLAATCPESRVFLCSAVSLSREIPPWALRPPPAELDCAGGSNPRVHPPCDSLSQEFPNDVVSSWFYSFSSRISAFFGICGFLDLWIYGFLDLWFFGSIQFSSFSVPEGWLS